MGATTIGLEEYLKVAEKWGNHRFVDDQNQNIAEGHVRVRWYDADFDALGSIEGVGRYYNLFTRYHGKGNGRYFWAEISEEDLKRAAEITHNPETQASR